MRFGKSFRLNILERVIPVSQTGDDKPLYDAGYRYRLVDSDGTAHYYKTTATAGRFVHEFNDKNVLTKPATDSNNYYKITFEDGSGKTYGSDTCLRKITDKNGVSQTIAYAGGRITGVTDGAGRTATFTYNASNYLTSITDPAGRSTSFTYTDNWHLRSIVYPDGKATTFYYTSSGGKIAQIVTVDSSDILFTYKTVASKEKIFYRVTGAERRGKYESAIAGRQTLNKLTFQYRTGDTVVTDLNGNANYIIFDNAGRTIGTRDHSGALSTVRYNTIGNKNNKPDRSSDSFSNVFNLAENHSFERANLDYWTIYADSDYYTTGFLTSGAYMGHKALRLTMTQRGSVLFNQNFSNVSAGQKYTFSAYVKINGTLTNGVADLLIEAKNGGTILSSTRSTGITTTNNEWVRIQVNVTLPANCNLVRVYGAINNGTGTAYFDAVQMESGHAMNRYNLLENNGFNNVTSGNIDHWTFENCTSSDGPTINTNNNTNAARIYGNYTARKRVKQDVRINGKAGDTLVFGAWAKAACSAGGNNGTRKFGIIIDLYSGASLVQSGNAVFNEDAINSFQYVTGAITTTTAYDTVKYYLVYYNEVNSVIFENAHLYFDAYGSTYEYDSNGKLKLQKNGAGNAIKYTYNGPDITKIALEKDGVEKQTVIYTYDSKHNLLTAKTNRGVTTNYTYPSSGNKGLPISITVRSSDGTITSANSFVYSSNYNYLLSQTDARGNTTSYEYDNGVTPIKKGLLTKVTDPDGNATEYTYNANTDICTSVGGKPDAGTTVTNSYTFNSNYELTKINHNGFSYNFTYDAFGRPQQTKVNAQPLCTYAYNADGTLASETYGNGDVNSYAYDSLDRLISQSYNGTARYTYAYNAENQLARHQDSENGVVWTYGYDLAGRITEQDCSNKTAVRYTYDDTGNIGSYRVSKDSALLSGATYTYIQDSLLRTVTMNSMDNLVITYNYDGLNRCKSRVQTYNPAEPDNDIRTSYLYLEGAGSDTTGLIRYISYVKYNSNVSQGPIKPSFYYTYDNKGNILTVKEGNVLKVTYTYDGLSRLVREDNVWLDKSVTYTYDNGGNILNKKYYAYTTGELSSVLDTVDYTYDSVWKDKLTSYNGGSTITYDEIGNPLTYRGYNLTWVKGRQLRLVQGNGVSQIYNYNADGLRTRSYSGSKFKFTYYTYASGLLVSQTDGTNTLNFVYSPAGEALGFTCNGTKYFYMRNVQGDVIGIYDSTGTVVVEYTYDAWGKPNSVTGSLASTIGVINPLRYRGYYYDDETGFYYLQSRYYDPETGRFLNADGELAGVGESVQGYNLFAYCHNNPVNMSDPDGNWPKWLTGALNVVSGALQMAAGAALGATVGWTGVGAVAAGFLIVNGAATATQGVGQIVNDVTKSNVMREDNIVRTGVKSVGKEIEGKTGEKVAGFAYDTAVVAANLYAGKVGLEKSMPKIIESKVFSANNGYGFKLGKNIEMFYRNPNAAGGPGGTIFSYKGPLGKFRIDWDPAHSFHCHPPGH